MTPRSPAQPADSSTPPGSLAPTTKPTQIGSDPDWSAVMTGGSRNNESCALKTDGSLWCWGVGAAPISPFVATPVPIH